VPASGGEDGLEDRAEEAQTVGAAEGAARVPVGPETGLDGVLGCGIRPTTVQLAFAMSRRAGSASGWRTPGRRAWDESHQAAGLLVTTEARTSGYDTVST
jgi:hypothetical protein